MTINGNTTASLAATSYGTHTHMNLLSTHIHGTSLSSLPYNDYSFLPFLTTDKTSVSNAGELLKKKIAVLTTMQGRIVNRERLQISIAMGLLLLLL